MFAVMGGVRRKHTLAALMMIGFFLLILFICSSEPIRDLQEVYSVLDDEIDKLRVHSASQSTTRLQSIQDRIFCLALNGTWRVMEPFETRLYYPNSTRYPILQEYIFSEECFPSAASFLLSVESLCSQLQGEKIVFIGSDTTYRLHISWLEALEAHEGRSHACLGTEFCTFHQICREPAKDGEPFRVPGGFVKYPSNRDLLSTHSAILRFFSSPSLYAGKNPGNPRYTNAYAQIDATTGIRMREMFWLSHVRKSHIIVLNRGPIPAPSWTYDGTDNGNWSFLDEVSPALFQIAGTEQAQKIVAAALDVTISRFLPEVIQTLEVIRQEPDIRNKVLIWHGNRFAASRSCANASNDRKLPFPADNPWSFYYNAQGKFQPPIV